MSLCLFIVYHNTLKKNVCVTVVLLFLISIPALASALDFSPSVVTVAPTLAFVLSEPAETLSPPFYVPSELSDVLIPRFKPASGLNEPVPEIVVFPL